MSAWQVLHTCRTNKSIVIVPSVHAIYSYLVPGCIVRKLPGLQHTADYKSHFARFWAQPEEACGTVSRWYCWWSCIACDVYQSIYRGSSVSEVTVDLLIARSQLFGGGSERLRTDAQGYRANRCLCARGLRCSRELQPLTHFPKRQKHSL